MTIYWREEKRLRGIQKAKNEKKMGRKKDKDKIENIFVRIDPDWRGCDFKYKGWVK